MTLTGLKKRMVSFCVNKIFVGTKSQYFEIKRKLLNSIGHEIGKDTKIVGPINCTGKLVVGQNCWLGANITVHGNGKVFIGDNCDIAPDVIFQTGSHEIGASFRRAGIGFNKEIEIGEGCWIGVRCTILPNVKIGSGCVIAACSCINMNIEENSLAGGVPGRIIKSLKDV